MNSKEIIYKVNQIILSEDKKTFAVLTNKGIAIFNSNNFKEKEDQRGLEDIGNIKTGVFIKEPDYIVLLYEKGKNEKFKENELILYAISSSLEIASFKVVDGILELRNAGNCIIVKTLKHEITVFDVKSLNEFKQVIKLKLEDATQEIYEAWSLEENDINKIYIATINKKEVCLHSYNSENFNLLNKLNFNSPMEKLQSLFYVKEINYIFLLDEKAKYITGFDPSTGTEKINLFRGSIDGVINSISVLNKKYLVISSKNTTIHICNLNYNEYNPGIIEKIQNYAYDTFFKQKLMQPCFRIHFADIRKDEITKTIDTNLCDGDFDKKGAIVFSPENNDDLYVILYNGFGYHLKVNVTSGQYDKINKRNLTEPVKENKMIHLQSDIDL